MFIPITQGPSFNLARAPDGYQVEVDQLCQVCQCFSKKVFAFSGDLALERAKAFLDQISRQPQIIICQHEQPPCASRRSSSSD